MDLKPVIAELRAELESIDHVVLALEKLAELQRRRSTTVEAVGSEGISPRPLKKRRAIREAANATAGE